MAKNTVTMPPFGDILNASIQTVKFYNTRNNGIPQKTFFNYLNSLAGITEEHLEIGYLDTNLAKFFDSEDDALVSAYDTLTDLALTCLVAMGAVKSSVFNLQPNIGQTFSKLVSFNEKITPQNLHQIDPFGKIYFWLAGENFRDYTFSHVPDNTYLSNLDRYSNKSFQELKAVNEECYGKEGDPLINHLIKETMRRTSVFMNNFADEVVANNYVKVTPDMIMAQIMNLTPLQFEKLCVTLVETALLNETPDSEVKSKHTGKSNDGGLDGIVTQKFENGEVHTYYIQSKLYHRDNAISNSNLRNFVGGYPPDKQFHHGFFITTSDFTKPAEEYAQQLNTHDLILINYMTLIDLMIEHEVGLQKVQTETTVMDNQFFKKLKRY